jgi:hypothetical protein
MSEDNQICRFLGADTTRFGNLQASGGEEKKGRRSNGKMGMSHGRELKILLRIFFLANHH